MEDKSFFVLRIARQTKDTTSNVTVERKMPVSLPNVPGAAANDEPSTSMEIWPTLKKKMMTTVEIKMALGLLLIKRVLIAITRKANATEKRNGRMTILASTSWIFQVSSARLG